MSDHSKCSHETASEASYCEEAAALHAALAGLQQEADGQRQARDTAESSLAQALLAKDSAIQRANRAESQRDRAVEVLRLLCDAAFVSETQFVCPTAFEPAVRAARALLKDAPCPRP